MNAHSKDFLHGSCSAETEALLHRIAAAPRGEAPQHAQPVEIDVAAAMAAIAKAMGRE